MLSWKAFHTTGFSHLVYHYSHELFFFCCRSDDVNVPSVPALQEISVGSLQARYFDAFKSSNVLLFLQDTVSLANGSNFMCLLNIMSFLSLFFSFFLFLWPCLIHARMPDWGRAYVHGHTFLHSWSGPMTLVVGLLHGATFLSNLKAHLHYETRVTDDWKTGFFEPDWGSLDHRDGTNGR